MADVLPRELGNLITEYAMLAPKERLAADIEAAAQGVTLFLRHMVIDRVVGVAGLVTFAITTGAYGRPRCHVMNYDGGLTYTEVSIECADADDLWQMLDVDGLSHSFARANGRALGDMIGNQATFEATVRRLVEC
jgi:hypothetical protein